MYMSDTSFLTKLNFLEHKPDLLLHNGMDRVKFPMSFKYDIPQISLVN